MYVVANLISSPCPNDIYPPGPPDIPPPDISPHVPPDISPPGTPDLPLYIPLVPLMSTKQINFHTSLNHSLDRHFPGK